MGCVKSFWISCRKLVGFAGVCFILPSCSGDYREYYPDDLLARGKGCQVRSLPSLDPSPSPVPSRRRVYWLRDIAGEKKEEVAQKAAPEKISEPKPIERKPIQPKPIEPKQTPGKEVAVEKPTPIQTYANKEAEEEFPQYFEVTVKGLSLSVISTIVYNTSKRWQEIAEWNGISNPNVILFGQKLRLKGPVRFTDEQIRARVNEIWFQKFSKQAREKRIQSESQSKASPGVSVEPSSHPSENQSVIPPRQQESVKPPSNQKID